MRLEFSDSARNSACDALVELIERLVALDLNVDEIRRMLRVGRNRSISVNIST